MIRRKKLFNFINRTLQSVLHEELIYQIQGAIGIELGNYIYDKNWMDWINKNEPSKPQLNIHCLNTGDGLNIFIVDRRYAEVKGNDIIFNCNEEDMFAMEDKLMIGHYHSDDLLWLILNFEKEIRIMKNKINSYIENNY